MKKFAIFFLTLSLLSIGYSHPSMAMINIGDTCSKNGMIFAKNLICKKVKNKLIWQMVKQDSLKASEIQPDTKGTICAADPKVPKEWAEYEKFALKTFHCSRPLRFVDVSLPSTKPKSNLTTPTSNLETCKIKNAGQYQTVGFPTNRWYFSGDLNVAVIPLQFTDYPTTKTPAEEYKYYFNYLKEMYYKISDGNTRLNFIIPNKYLEVGKSIESYVVPGNLSKNNGRFIWKKLDLPRYRNDVYTVADKNIDFTGIDLAIQIIPFNMPNTYIAHSGEFRMDNVQTNEGVVEYNYLWPEPAWTDGMAWTGAEPFLHLHEIFHATGLLTDHYGDDTGEPGSNLGTGNWGNMSGMITDFIMWDKWMAGMATDSQVICADPNMNSTFWIKPMEYFGKNEKMVVVPVSATKAIAIESRRAGGMDFKLNKASEGALVYLINTLDNGHGAGINVFQPTGRKTSYYDRFFRLADAPLKLNESVTLEGYKISVVESGKFGDVVKVEKV